MKKIYEKYLKPFIPKSWFSIYHHTVRRSLFWFNRKSQALIPWREGERNLLQKYFLENTGRLIHKYDHYFDIYDRHLARFRGKPVTVLEIGVYHGGSLQMWREYFGPAAKIIGVDINPACQVFSGDGIEVVIGSQEDRNFLASLREQFPQFDVVIDDGGHTMRQQIITFEELYCHVKPDGVFLAEDLSTSYWPEYGGGYKNKESFIEYTKPLIDRLNAWHSKDEALTPDEFTRSTTSLHYYDSILVIEKGQHERPVSHMTGKPSF